MNKLIFVDVISELKKEIAEIKNKISVLLQEKEDLEFNVCPKLKAEYYEKIGKIEVQIRMLELTAAELKFRISIIQAALNRREKISEKTVEKKVEKEYSEYRKKVDEAYEEAEKEKSEEESRQKQWQQNYEKYERSEKDEADKNEKAHSEENQSGDYGEKEEKKEQSSGAAKDSEYKKMSFSQKLKELYRRIVKKLHPDINPNITEREKELFFETQKAYKNGDLEKLEEIYAEIMEEEKIQGNGTVSNDISQLNELKEKLIKKLHSVEREISAIKASFPYSAKDILKNPTALSEKQNELHEIIGKYEEIVSELQIVYEELKKELLNPDEATKKKKSFEKATNEGAIMTDESALINRQENEDEKKYSEDNAKSKGKPKKKTAKKKKTVEFWE